MSYAVPITLTDGKERSLRYDFGALICIEERLGISIDKLNELLTGSGRKLGVIRDLLWAGLIHEDKSLTPEAVAALVNPADLLTITETIAKALVASLAAEGEPKNAA